MNIINIGGAAFAVARPAADALDQDLIAATGCDTAEVARLLEGNRNAGLAARALQPFLGDDTPGLAELTTAIAEAGVGEVNDALRGLYGHDGAPPADSAADQDGASE